MNKFVFNKEELPMLVHKLRTYSQRLEDSINALTEEHESRVLREHKQAVLIANSSWFLRIFRFMRYVPLKSFKEIQEYVDTSFFEYPIGVENMKYKGYRDDVRVLSNLRETERALSTSIKSNAESCVLSQETICYMELFE